MSGWFAPARLGAGIEGPAVRNALAAAAAVAALAVCGAGSRAQTADTGPREPPPAAAGTGPAAGLDDLDAMTFDCAKTGLNAAAREAAKAPSRGAYQFTYFRIVNDTHHASYEVHFKSNHHAEPDLKYCVAVYCQQGWDRATTRASVRRVGDGHRPGAGAVHATDCGHAKPTPARRRPER